MLLERIIELLMHGISDETYLLPQLFGITVTDQIKVSVRIGQCGGSDFHPLLNL